MKHTLTHYELQLVSDPQILLAKNNVIKKVYEMFGDLSEVYDKPVKDLLPETSPGAKISRGENYEGLPYVMLDYPRQFGKVDVFAIRTFFWWGNFFSITLQLAGTHQQRFETKIGQAIAGGLLNDWYITSSGNAWHHRFDDGYYRPINKQENYKLRELAFIKLATKIPLLKWDEAEEFLCKNFSVLMMILKDQAPIR